LLIGTDATDTKLLYQKVEKLATTVTGVSITGLMASTSMNIGSTINITGVLDEDNMASDSAVKLATQQSIKAYVDGQAYGITAVVQDTTPQLGGNLDVNGNDITSPDGTDLIDIVNGTIDIQTDSTSRLDITDSGVRLGNANARVTTVLDEDNLVTTPSSLALDVSLADLASSGLTIEQTVDTNTVGAGGLLLKTDANWDDCDASAEATCDLMLGIAVDSGTGASKTILLQGLYRNDTLFALTPGAILWASETAGAITETKPTTSGAIQRIVGYAISADIIYFDPDKSYVEV
jgi:hypothetical protein